MLAKRIKELRTSNDLTQKDLAIYLGLTPKMISFYELGQRVPPSDIILKLATKFDVTTDYLLGRDIPAKTDKQISPTREKLLSKLERLTDEELLEMEQIADYIKSKKEKNEQAATTA